MEQQNKKESGTKKPATPPLQVFSEEEEIAYWASIQQNTEAMLAAQERAQEAGTGGPPPVGWLGKTSAGAPQNKGEIAAVVGTSEESTTPDADDEQLPLIAPLLRRDGAEQDHGTHSEDYHNNITDDFPSRNSSKNTNYSSRGGASLRVFQLSPPAPTRSKNLSDVETTLYHGADGQQQPPTVIRGVVPTTPASWVDVSDHYLPDYPDNASAASVRAYSDSGVYYHGAHHKLGPAAHHKLNMSNAQHYHGGENSATMNKYPAGPGAPYGIPVTSTTHVDAGGHVHGMSPAAQAAVAQYYYNYNRYLWQQLQQRQLRYQQQQTAAQQAAVLPQATGEVPTEPRTLLMPPTHFQRAQLAAAHQQQNETAYLPDPTEDLRHHQSSLHQATTLQQHDQHVAGGQTGGTGTWIEPLGISTMGSGSIAPAYLPDPMADSMEEFRRAATATEQHLSPDQYHQVVGGGRQSRQYHDRGMGFAVLGWSDVVVGGLADQSGEQRRQSEVYLRQLVDLINRWMTTHVFPHGSVAPVDSEQLFESFSSDSEWGCDRISFTNETWAKFSKAIVGCIWENTLVVLLKI